MVYSNGLVGKRNLVATKYNNLNWKGFIDLPKVLKLSGESTHMEKPR